MKIITFSIILFFLLSSMVYAELTKDDLEEIRAIVKESEERLNKRIDDFRVDVKDDIASLKEDLDKKIDDRIGDLKWMVGLMFGGIIAIIAATLTIPQIVAGRKERKASEDKIIALEKEINEIKTMLKTKQEV